MRSLDGRHPPSSQLPDHQLHQQAADGDGDPYAEAEQDRAQAGAGHLAPVGGQADGGERHDDQERRRGVDKPQGRRKLNTSYYAALGRRLAVSQTSQGGSGAQTTKRLFAYNAAG